MAIKVQGDTVIYDDKVVQVGSGTTAQRPASPQNGMIRYNITEQTFEGYTDGEWGPLSGGGAIEDLFFENARTITQNYTISATRNTMTIGPITIEDNVTVTIPDGARWVIL